MKFFPRRLITIFAICLAFAMPTVPKPAYAQQILRDAETEWFLREISTPYFEAAGLNPDSIQIYIIHHNSINAFATLGQVMGIFSGLIQTADTVN